MGTIFEQMVERSGDLQSNFQREYHTIIDEMASLFQERNDQDYNQMVAIPDYFLFGEYSHAHMLWLKCLRAINQLVSGADPTDSLLDAANYAIFAVTDYNLRNKEIMDAIYNSPEATKEWDQYEEAKNNAKKMLKEAEERQAEIHKHFTPKRGPGPWEMKDVLKRKSPDTEELNFGSAINSSSVKYESPSAEGRY